MPGDIEDVKAGVALWIASSRFTDALAAVNAEKADGYTTPDPRAVYAYERAVLENFPAAEVIGLNTVYEPDSDVKAATHRISVVWTQVGDTEATVATDVERLVRATVDAFWRSVLDGRRALKPIGVDHDDYSQLDSGRENGAFMKGGSVILICETYRS